MCLYIHIYEGRVEEKNHFVDESEIGMQRRKISFIFMTHSIFYICIFSVCKK